MGQTVLVVDDEVEIADLVELYLKNEGFEVRKFYNGRDALDCCLLYTSRRHDKYRGTDNACRYGHHNLRRKRG